MLRKQNHDILIASERAQCLTARRHFLTGLYFIHNSVILPTIHACNELDLGSWQLFLVGGHPWRGGSESFPPLGSDRTLPCIFQLSGSCWNWRAREEAARGSGTVPKVSRFWLQVSQRRLWRAGKTNALLSLQDDEDVNTGAVESKFWRFSFKEYVQRTMLLMILGQVQVC